MKRICPNPRIWSDIYVKLKKISDKNTSIPEPPRPIILGGWWCTGDLEKNFQWDATVRWINVYGGRELLENLTDENFHWAVEFGRPVEEKWSLQQTPSAEVYPREILLGLLKELANNWHDIAKELASRSKPVCFTGKKSRCLKIQIFDLEPPPWGTWGIGKINYRDVSFTNKNEFTKFRERVNSYLTPHQADHIKFSYKKF
jgi:hypothetical protein